VQVRIAGELQGHENHVDCVAWSHDGVRLASGSYDNTLRIWNTNWKCESVHYGHSQGISDVAWRGAAEDIVATASYDQTVRVWKPKSGEIYCFTDLKKPIRCVAWANSGRTIAAGDEGGSVQVWNWANHGTHRRYKSQGGWVNALAFNPVNDLIAIGLGNGDLLLRNPLAPQFESAFRAHHIYVNALAWMPNSKVLCTGSGSGSIGVWDTETGRNIAKLNGHSDRLFRMSFSNDGRLLASIGQDRLNLWRTSDWSILYTITGPFPSKTYLPLSFSPQGYLLATACADDLNCIQILAIDGV
jgi:WD40 repeat protein